MANIEKRRESYRITVSCGYDVCGRKKRAHMTWKPDKGMTERQIKKELERQAVLFEERFNGGGRSQRCDQIPDIRGGMV